MPEYAVPAMEQSQYDKVVGFVGGPPSVAAKASVEPELDGLPSYASLADDRFDKYK